MMDVDEALASVDLGIESRTAEVLANEVRQLRETLRASEVVRDLADRVDRIGELERELAQAKFEITELRRERDEARDNWFYGGEA